MKKAMKRSLSLIFALVMLLCAVPISTVAAASKESTVVVGRDRAPVRNSYSQDGGIVKRYNEGTTLTYTRLFINSKLNLWYKVKYGNGSYGWLYSGNVKKVSNAKDVKIDAQVAMSSDLLSKETCRNQAEKLLATGYDKEQMAKEIYAHAFAYYFSDAIIEQKVKLYLTDAVLCALFPSACITALDVTKAVIDFAKWGRKHAESVEIGVANSFEGIAGPTIYEIVWNMT